MGWADICTWSTKRLSRVEATPSLSRRRAVRRTALAWASGLLLGFALACQATIWLEPAPPELAVVEQLALQLSACAVLSAMLALLLRRWLRLAASLALAATLAAPTVNQAIDAGGAPGLSGATTLKVLSVNLWHIAPRRAATVAALIDSGADVIGLVEMTAEWRRSLQPVIDRYPYRVDCFAQEPDCETMLLSNWPIERPIAGRIWKSNPIVAGGDILWQDRRLTILVTHLTRPLVRKEESRWYDAAAADPADYLEASVPFNRQATQAGRLARFLNGQAPDLVLLGDMNAVPWSRVQRAFRARTGLDNRAGWAATWPAQLPWPLRLPLDHVLARGRAVVSGFAAGTRIDSDHLPVLAEIGWRE